MDLRGGPICDYEFSDDQTWLKTSSDNLNFVDESRDLAFLYQSEQTGKNSPDASVGNLPSGSNRPESLHIRDGSFGSMSISSLASPMKKRRLVESPMTSYASVNSSPVNASAVIHSPAESREDFPTAELRQIQSNPHNFLFGPSPSAIEVDTPNFSAHTEAPAKLYLEDSIWPLARSEEARLTRYFIENLAVSFDLCDVRRHFELVVPQVCLSISHTGTR